MQKQVQSSKDMHSLNDAGEKKKGRPRIQYIDNIKKWTRASLEENVRLTEVRTAWRELPSMMDCF